jgi:hypothetical protein
MGTATELLREPAVDVGIACSVTGGGVDGPGRIDVVPVDPSESKSRPGTSTGTRTATPAPSETTSRQQQLNPSRLRLAYGRQLVPPPGRLPFGATSGCPPAPSVGTATRARTSPNNSQHRLARRCAAFWCIASSGTACASPSVSARLAFARVVRAGSCPTASYRVAVQAALPPPWRNLGGGCLGGWAT